MMPHKWIGHEVSGVQSTSWLKYRPFGACYIREKGPQYLAEKALVSPGSTREGGLTAQDMWQILVETDCASGGSLSLTFYGETVMSLAMTLKEREVFLAAVHVGIISIAEEGRGPLTVPIWYAYEPGGEIRVVTDRTSRKGRLLEKVGRFSLCAQTEAPPYKYVSVEGPILAMEPADLERDLRPLAHRYLGVEPGDQYIEATRGDRERGGSVLIRMRPERWLTVDYAKQYGS